MGALESFLTSPTLFLSICIPQFSEPLAQNFAKHCLARKILGNEKSVQKVFCGAHVYCFNFNINFKLDRYAPVLGITGARNSKGF